MEYSTQKINEIHDIVYNKYLSKYPDKMSRFTHIEGVAKMCKYLAQIYNVDESKAEICGLIHDYYKYESEEEMQKLIDPKDQDECMKFKVLYHSYASGEALKNVFGIDDKEMKSAIRNHVFGHLNMTRLEEIVLISDYTEENRTYPSCINARNILLSGNLDKAILESTKDTVKYVIKKGDTPHPLQYEIIKEYERKIIMNKIEIIINGLKRINPHDVVVYDSNEKSPFFDFILVASVDSVRQASQAIMYIKEELAKENLTIKSSEGEDSNWVLIDGFDYLVHIMTDEERERIAIDKLYMNFEKINIEKYFN